MSSNTERTQTTSKPRNYYFDNLKFILILLVVLGHAYSTLKDDSPLVNSAYLTIYTFHMPLMILASGFFAKNIHREGQSKKLIATILIPYLIFETLYSVYDHVIFNTDALDLSILKPYWIMWFMFSLFLWRLMLPYFVNLKYPLITSYALAILVGYINDADKLLSLSRTIAFFPFFLTGYYLQNHHLEVLFSRWKRVFSWIGLGLLFVMYWYLVFHTSIDLNFRKWLYFVYPYESLNHSEWYAGAIRLGFFGLTLLASIFVLAITPRRKTFFSELGSRSLYVYLLHGFFIKAYNGAHLDDKFASPIYYIIVSICAIALTFLLSSRFVQRIGQPLLQPRVQWLFRSKNKRQKQNLNKVPG
ncbi:acyltransferase family protein [Marininema halotolerans]|uniref:Fucose 4-O-acetylase n=1 Tax=Marininema halotolerans TaxID=1155944 RepID=A0A1I6RLU9_9BACL|nr:acyltransferase family protein [Marininema halotolerans]SFS65634.1 Fucose 4-O-acetylase [Marininema halotolerans]